jgi:alcohol dehydrogenase class IV
MNSFELSLPSKITFGDGCVNKLGVEVAPHAKHVLLVSGGNPDRIEKVLWSLKTAGVAATFCVVQGEPTLEAVRGGVRLAQKAGCSGVVAVGGGSVIDAAKAIAAMAVNPGDLMDYLEVIGQGRPLTREPLYIAAVPTTAGTGSEATRNAVLTSSEHRVKVSLRHPSMVPKAVLLDPSLTLTLSPEVTASTGMDALTQLLESFTCRNPNPFTDALCREGLKLVARSLQKAYEDGKDLEARSDMLLAAHFSGQALANARLGAVHGFTAALGGVYRASHGALCAALLPSVTQANLRALAERSPEHPSRERYAEAARILTGEKGAKAENTAEYCEKLRASMKIPTLSQQGVQKDDFEILAERTSRASSMKGNPVDLTMEELIGILGAAF